MCVVIFMFALILGCFLLFHFFFSSIPHRWKKEYLKEYLSATLNSIVSQTTCNLNHPSFLPVLLKLHERYGFPVSL